MVSESGAFVQKKITRQIATNVYGNLFYVRVVRKIIKVDRTRFGL